MNTKRCPKCKQEKPTMEFGLKTRAKDKLQAYCLICMRAAHNDWYARNAEARKPSIHARTREQREKSRELAFNYLATHPCVDCGEADIRVLEFDHRSDKEADISRLLSYGTPRRLMDEIAKCDVRCANCHRKRHIVLNGGARNLYWLSKMG